MFSGFHKKIRLKKSDVWRKVISNKIVVTVVTQGLPSSFLSRPVALFSSWSLEINDNEQGFFQCFATLFYSIVCLNSRDTFETQNPISLSLFNQGREKNPFILVNL